MADMKIQSTVTIDESWKREFLKDDNIIFQLVSIHIYIDRVTKKKECVIYTDDGRGRGSPILSFDMRSPEAVETSLVSQP